MSDPIDPSRQQLLGGLAVTTTAAAMAGGTAQATDARRPSAAAPPPDAGAQGASEGILYPEIARCHAMRGAEILLLSSSEGLREYRRRPGMGNLLSRQACDLYAGSYAAADFRRRNGLWRDGRVVVPERSYFVEAQRDTLARLTAGGIIAEVGR